MCRGLTLGVFFCLENHENQLICFDWVLHCLSPLYFIKPNKTRRYPKPVNSKSQNPKILDLGWLRYQYLEREISLTSQIHQETEILKKLSNENQKKRPRKKFQSKFQPIFSKIHGIIFFQKSGKIEKIFWPKSFIPQNFIRILFCFQRKVFGMSIFKGAQPSTKFRICRKFSEIEKIFLQVRF